MRTCALAPVVHDIEPTIIERGLNVGKIVIDQHQHGVSYAKCDIPGRRIQDFMEALSGAAGESSVRFRCE